MTITPQSSIKLCTTPLTKDYQNSITWENIQSQKNYFNNLQGYTDNEYTYIKQDNLIRVNKNIDEIINYNYLIYTNTGFTTKTYYCFITNMTYLSENCTTVTFETDVLQTYYFDITYKASFVEREHVDDDTIGKHTVPENVMTGDYVAQTYNQSTLSTDYCFLLGTTASPIDGSDCVGLYGGLPSGCAYFGYDIDSYGIDILRENLQYLTNEGKANAVTGLFVCPKSFVVYESSGKQIENSIAPHHTSLTIAPITHIDEETPLNKKLLTYPYCYYLVTNGAGNSMVLQPELFSNPNENHEFNIYGVVTPSMSIIGVPKGYASRENENNYQYSLPLAKFPQLNYSTDQFINWLTENGTNVQLGAIQGGANVVGGLLNLNPSSITTGLSQIFNSIHSEQMADRVPPSFAGNSNSGDIMFSNNQLDFKIYTMTIKSEYRKIIDNYFSVFGYKINRYKIPQFNSRNAWNYIKTIELEIEGNIPQNYIQIIKQAFNNGITWWHDANKVLDYTQSNNIVK